MEPLAFTVPGRPQQAGSARGFAVRRGGAYTGRVIVTDDNPRARSYSGTVGTCALEARNLHPQWPAGELVRGGARVRVDFYFARPKGHFGSGRNAGRVLASAPVAHVVKPDLDKLVRAVLDGCTGVVWRDDSQVISVQARKLYGEPERAEVMVH